MWPVARWPGLCGTLYIYTHVYILTVGFRRARGLGGPKASAQRLGEPMVAAGIPRGNHVHHNPAERSSPRLSPWLGAGGRAVRGVCGRSGLLRRAQWSGPGPGLFGGGGLPVPPPAPQRSVVSAPGRARWSESGRRQGRAFWAWTRRSRRSNLKPHRRTLRVRREESNSANDPTPPDLTRTQTSQGGLAAARLLSLQAIAGSFEWICLKGG